ncbi:MAG: monovalent cation:proton antiporter-2 (CPA2) family protein [Thermodesulfovibrionales bacterium]|nr:monovalent cation:proton antiporter-2 (CPA2) family protein [Thermodesulfovibrionales bacterium]
MEFLKLIVIIFGVSLLVVMLFHRLRLPSIIGFLISGIIIGPHGIGIIKDTHAIETLAEIGVILLLFTVGIEFSLEKLLRMKKVVLGAGLIQVVSAILLSSLLSYAVGLSLKTSLLFGALISLSSTAIVLKLFSDRAELDTPHGRLGTGILIFQDLCVVPFMLFIPLLSGEEVRITEIFIKLSKAVFIILMVLLSARWLVPFILYQIVKTKSRELFITSIIVICLGIAFITSRFGLSFALGAFIAGLIISESEYSHQATADILPFKESFMALFFISIGMLMDMEVLSGNCLNIALTILFIIILKIITTTGAGIIIGKPLRTSIITGLALFQVGEFSFVLANQARALNLMSFEFYQIFLSSAVITMLLTPFTIIFAPALSGFLTGSNIIRRALRIKKFSESEGYPRKKHDHVVIIGFGLNGRNLARVLREAGIPYVILDMNIDTVMEMKKRGEPIYYGDGTSKEILEKLGVKRAKILVIAISDPVSTRAIVSIARQENPSLFIIVRTRYVIEVDELKKLGADEVIPEEFETSIEIFSRVLHKYNVPRNVIFEFIEGIRRDSYSALRKVELPQRHLAERVDILKIIETETFLIKDTSPAKGHSIKELNLRAQTGASIIAIQRGDEIFQNPSPDFVLQDGDIVLLIGKRSDIEKAIEYLDSGSFVISKYH